MRNVFPSIVRKLTNISVAVGLGAMTLLGGVAGAETVQQRAVAELNNGKDYDSAWQAASRATSGATSGDSAPQVDRIAAAMNAGKDYVAAWDAARSATDRVPSDAQIARSRRVEAALNAGQDYAAAWSAPDAAQAAESAKTHETLTLSRASASVR